MEIKKTTDYLAIMAMDKVIFGGRDVMHLYEWKQSDVYFLYKDNEPIGCLCIKKNVKSWYINSIGILPGFRGFGFGEYLLKFAVDEFMYSKVGKITAHIRLGNNASICLNLKQGFKIKKVIKNWYENPKEDAVFIELARREKD